MSENPEGEYPARPYETELGKNLKATINEAIKKALLSTKNNESLSSKVITILESESIVTIDSTGERYYRIVNLSPNLDKILIDLEGGYALEDAIKRFFEDPDVIQTLTI